MSKELETALVENRRLRERLERHYAESRWLEDELRTRQGEIEAIVIEPGDLAVANAGNGALIAPPPEPPPPEAWPRGPRPPYVLTPSPGLGTYAMGRERVKVIGIGICGLPTGKIETVIDMVEDRQRRTRDFSPVFLTDSDRTDLFRRRAYAYEYLPAIDMRSEACRVFAEDRIAFLQEKWGMAGIVNFGSSGYPLGINVGGGGLDDAVDEAIAAPAGELH